jgi:peptide/nickel transport system substrate-binding protein
VNKYFKPAPKLRTITFHLFSTFSDALADFRNGSDAIVARTPSERAQLLAAHRGTTTDVDTFQFDDLVINERIAGLNDPVVRSAISQQVNRDAIVEQALQGQGVVQSTAIPAGITWAQPSPSQAQVDDQDLGGSGALSVGSSLADDGWAAGSDGVLSRAGTELRFRIAVPAVSALEKTAQLIVNSLSNAGFAVTVDTVPEKNFVNQVLDTGDFDLAVVDWANGPDPDISEFWRSNATPPHGFNVSGGQPDVFLDQSLDSLATVSDLNGRRAAAAAVAADLSSDIPAVFLDTPTVTVDLAPGLKGVNIPATGGSGARFANVVEWSR